MAQKDSVLSKEIRHYLGGNPVADSDRLQWNRIQAQAYCYENPYPGAWQIPWVEDGYLIEIQTSHEPVRLDQKISQWQTQYWQRGEMVFFPAGHNTRWRWHDALNTVAFIISFEQWRHIALDQFGSRGCTVELVPKFSPDDATLKQLLLMLADELLAGGPNGSLFADGLAIATIAHLLRHHSTYTESSHPISPSSSDIRFKRVIEFIEENLDQPLSIDDLATESGVGLSYFPRFFRQITGLTPYQFLLRRRLDRAMRLLKNPSLNIADIALSVGFTSQSHFTTAFRKGTGTTPALYRNQMNV